MAPSRLYLGAALLLASCAAASPATAFVDVFGMDGARIKRAAIDVRGDGLPGFEAMVELAEEGELRMSYQRMGEALVPVIMALEGERASFPSTGWFLDHIPADGPREENVGIGAVTLRGGSVLEWRLRKFGGAVGKAAAAAAEKKAVAEAAAEAAAAAGEGEEEEGEEL